MYDFALEIARVPMVLEISPDRVEEFDKRLGSYRSKPSGPIRVSFRCDREVPREGPPMPVVSTREDGLRIRQSHMFSCDVSYQTNSMAITLDPRVTDSEGESRFRQSLKAYIAIEVVRRGGVLLHSGGVEYAGRAVLFSGQSDAGKSTITSFFPEENILNDDMLALYPEDDGTISVEATPFTGTMDMFTRSRRCRLERAFLLKQAPETRIVPLSPIELRMGLFQNVCMPSGYEHIEGLGENLMENVAKISSFLQLDALEFELNPERTRAFIESVLDVHEAA